MHRFFRGIALSLYAGAIKRHIRFSIGYTEECALAVIMKYEDEIAEALGRDDTVSKISRVLVHKYDDYCAGVKQRLIDEGKLSEEQIAAPPVQFDYEYIASAKKVPR